MESRFAERWSQVVPWILILVVVIFNAVELFPEVSIPVPSLNDDAMHYLFVNRASAAVAEGQNPIDFWFPQIELGFPQFLYYQHLPALTVVALHRALLKRVELLTIFNLIRYLLMVGFPFTIYWSMRVMDFSPITAIVAAAAAPLLSTDLYKYGYGFEFESYIWYGFGMYTQLWAMHLFFLSIAYLWRVITKADSYLAAIVVCSVMVLSHLIYAYMVGIAVLVMFLLNLREQERPAEL
jgi:uncharacterized membrane protein